MTKVLFMDFLKDFGPKGLWNYQTPNPTKLFAPVTVEKAIPKAIIRNMGKFSLEKGNARGLLKKAYDFSKGTVFPLERLQVLAPE